jgi:hypothetical protein
LSGGAATGDTAAAGVLAGEAPAGGRPDARGDTVPPPGDADAGVVGGTLGTAVGSTLGNAVGNGSDGVATGSGGSGGNLTGSVGSGSGSVATLAATSNTRAVRSIGPPNLTLPEAVSAFVNDYSNAAR